MNFEQEIWEFLARYGLEPGDDIVPVPLRAHSPQEAWAVSLSLAPLVGKAIFVYEDRWRSSSSIIGARLLSHRNIFRQVYARNCEVRRIDKPTAAAFLRQSHSYGDASCRYRYGLFLKSLTGEKCQCESIPAVDDGQLVAVAEFSSARKWTKGERQVRSYEWVRYSSLPFIRISGGMGKVLEEFVKEVRPDDVMSYADLEWSDGGAYRQLGFVEEGRRDPVTFAVNPPDWNRKPVGEDFKATGNELFLRNFGSVKYRLKLTEY